MSGEAQEATLSAGVAVARLRLRTTLSSDSFCGVGGTYPSLDYVTRFSRQPANERGLIAPAAIFFARGRPFGTAAITVLRGAATALACWR